MQLIDVIYATAPVTISHTSGVDVIQPIPNYKEAVAEEKDNNNVVTKQGIAEQSEDRRNPRGEQASRLIKRKLIYGYAIINNGIDLSLTDISNGEPTTVENNALYTDVWGTHTTYEPSKLYVLVVEQLKRPFKVVTENNVTTHSPTDYKDGDAELYSSEIIWKWVTTAEGSYYVKKDKLAGIYEVYDRSIHNYIGTVSLDEREFLNGYRATESNVENKNGVKWYGTGILDRLTMYLNDNLAIQYEAGRITSDQYGQTYIQGMQAVLQSAVQYVLQRGMTEASIEKTMAGTELSQRQSYGFDDNIAAKYLSEIGMMSQIFVGADLDSFEKVPGIARPLSVSETFKRFSGFLNLPTPSEVMSPTTADGETGEEES